MIPRPFGFPLWINCKRRIAKKWINKRGRNLLKRLEHFHNAPTETLICTCSGLNEKPEKVIPIYRQIGKKSFVLFDLDFENQSMSCSFYHCGVGPAKSYDECLEYIEKVIEYYSKTNDSYGFAERYKNIILNEDGTFKINKGR